MPLKAKSVQFRRPLTECSFVAGSCPGRQAHEGEPCRARMAGGAFPGRRGRFPAAHLLFSTALLKSGTLYYPIGIHLGNNWAAHHLFSSGTGGIDPTPSGDAFFVVTVPAGDPSQIQIITGYLITFLCFLIFTWIIRKWQRTPAYPEKMRPGITRDPG